MKTGIIVARFQTSYLHEAHRKLIEYVKNENERVIIFLGTSVTRLTINNPLDFEARKQMILSDYPYAEVFPLPDMKYDDQWVINLDNLIHKYYWIRNSPQNPSSEDDYITLYASRGGFLSSYSGKYKWVFLPDIIIEGLSATDIRNTIHSNPINSKDWREGVIWASSHKYPVSYQTVDVAIVDFYKNRILLGKKPNESKYRFIGGFQDPSANSLEENCKKEVQEEVGNIETDAYKYICSTKINDWRYKKSQDCIMTAFFCCSYIFGHIKAGDDIHEATWFNISELNENLFESEHIILFNQLIQYLNSKTK